MNAPNAPVATSSLDLSLLNGPQKEAVLHGTGPLLILAGAGTGKTRVITYRIAHLLECGAYPWSILAVTFTNKAAAEMRDRVFQLTQGKSSGVSISTFHSFCAQFLRSEGPRYGISRDFTIYDDDDQKKILKDCFQELGLDEKKLAPNMLASKISREKDQLMDAESFAISAAVANDPNREIFASIYTLYEKKLKAAGAFDFGDLILKSVQLLHNNKDLADKMQERFHHVLVDEYQDTNRAQYILTKMLASKYKNICVVGDDDQSIYSWRGADIRNILEFEKDYPSVHVVKLEQNYRSTQPILDAAWKLVQNNRMRKDKKLWTERDSDQPIEFQWLGNENAEAGRVAETVSDIAQIQKRPFSHFAVFYRTNAQSRVLEDAFRRAEIPYILVGNVRFYERAEVKDVLAYLKTIMNPNDSLSLKRIINFPTRGIGKTTIESIERFAALNSISLYEALKRDDLYAALNFRTGEKIRDFVRMLQEWTNEREKLTVHQLLNSVLDKIKILDLMKEEARTDLEAAGRLDNVQELMNAAEEFEERSDDKSTRAYLEQVSLMTNLDTVEDKKNGVMLMTVHVAKGLEFPVVFVTGLEEGLFPLGETQFEPDELEEERRLAYVAMTRAKEKLFLTCAASRRLYGQIRWNMPSRFIAEAGIQTGEKPQEEWGGYDAPSMPGYGQFQSRGSAPRSAGSSEFSEPKSSGGAFRVGQRVRHAEFGEGSVTQRSGAGDELKVTVQFDSGQWKKLLVKYAPLEKL